MKNRINAFLVVSFALSGIAFSADVLTVGPGGQFASLQAAVYAAADGDIVLVRSANHSTTTIGGKGLTIVADKGVNVNVFGGLLIEFTAPQQTVVLVGISATGVGVKQPGLRVRQCQGPVRIQGGTFIGDYGYNPYPPPPDSHADGWPGAWISNCSTVSMSGVKCVGGSGAWVEDWWTEYPTGDGAPGLFVRSTQVALYGCNLAGGHGGSCLDVADLDGGNGGAGLFSTRGFVFVARTTATGGSGGKGGDASGLKFGGCGGIGGDGVHFEGVEANGQFLANAFVGGPGGYPGYYAQYCPGQSPPGQPVVTLQGASVAFLSGAARGFAIETPARELTAPLMTFSGQAGDKVWVDFGDMTQFLFVPTLHGVLLSQTVGFMPGMPLGVIGASGTLQVPWSTVRDLGPGVEGVVRHLQGRIVDGSGQVFLADHQGLVLLDASF